MGGGKNKELTRKTSHIFTWQIINVTQLVNIVGREKIKHKS